jgi:peptidyl-prolyl cis-trans isomerase D
MFDAVRNNKKIVQIFLALIILPFAFFGLDSYVRSTGTGDDIAKIGDIKITQQQFQQAMRDQQERLRAQMKGELDPKLLDTPEARQAILDDLVDQRLLMLEASKKKMFVSDDVIRRTIGSIDAFNADGKFSAERYEAALRGQGMTPAGFEAQLRQDLTLQQLAGAIGQSGVTPRTVIDHVLAIQTEKREVMEYRLAIDDFLGKVKLADGAAKKFYDENAKQFELPEQAKAEYVVLSMETIGAQLTVSEAEVKAWYEGHKDKFQQPEERRASHILIASEKLGKDKAKAKAEEVYQGGSEEPGRLCRSGQKEFRRSGLG